MYNLVLLVHRLQCRRGTVSVGFWSLWGAHSWYFWIYSSMSDIAFCLLHGSRCFDTSECEWGRFEGIRQAAGLHPRPGAALGPHLHPSHKQSHWGLPLQTTANTLPPLLQRTKNSKSSVIAMCRFLLSWSEKVSVASNSLKLLFC